MSNDKCVVLAEILDDLDITFTVLIFAAINTTIKWKSNVTRTYLSQTDRASAAHTICRGHLGL